MPYKSLAQNRLVHARAGAGEPWAKKFASDADAEVKEKKRRGEYRKPPERVEKSNKEDWAKAILAGTTAGALANQFPRVQDVHRKGRGARHRRGRVAKMLAPTSSDPFYNQDAAQKAFDLVMKMDYDTAQMFTTLVVGDVLDETISANLPTLQRHLNEVVAKRVEQLKGAVLRTIAKADDQESRDQGLAFAQALTLISKSQTGAFSKSKTGAFSKATPYDYGYRFTESDFRRDPSTGQFRVKIKPPTGKKLSTKQAETFNIAKPKKKLNPEQTRRYQSDYMQVAQFLAAVQQSGGMSNNDVLLHIKDKEGDVYTTYASTADPSGLWNPKTEKVIGASARPNTLNVSGAAFGLSHALGGNVQSSRRRAAGVGAIEAGMGDFSEGWTGAGRGDEAIRSSNSRLYGRTAAASDYLGRYGNATGNTQLQMAAAFGSFVGSHGPEAEKVIGPSMRKTAYRYRGTEKTPDPHIVSLYGRAVSSAKATGYERGTEAPPGVREPRRAGGVGPNEGPPVMRMAGARADVEARTPSWSEREPGRAAIIDQMKFKLPNPHLYGLQLAAGNTPPSEGILLNADGQIVSQAVGYGDDHYLPFNLKNLSALKGGEYIRTRSVGGPTSEDIYTGLMAGARRITVVSRSGTFTMEFDPSFRGGRRYNDKAMRMTDRYEHILDAVQSGQVDAKPVKPEIQQRIREEVDRDFPGWKPTEKQKVFTEKIEEYKSIKGLAPEDQAYIEARVSSELRRDPLTDEKQLRSDLTAGALAEKQFKYRLDGQGYGSAMKALEEQFPYYIKTDYEARRAEHITEQERDKGYVMPRHNRPTEALAGYFETRIAGESEGAGAYKTKTGEKTGKIHASDADYQNYRNRGTSSAPSTEPIPGPGGGSSPGTSTTPGGGASPVATPVTSGSSQTNQVRENIAERTDVREYVDRAWALATAARVPADAGGAEWLRQNPLIGLAKADNRSEFERQLGTPEGRMRFEEITSTAQFKTEADAQDPQLWLSFRNAANQVDLKNYSQVDSHRWLSRPWRFPGDAYRKTADPALVGRELDALNAHTFPVTGAKRYVDMSDSEKEQELKLLFLLKNEAGTLKGADPTTRRDALTLTRVGNIPNANKLIDDGEAKIQEQIDNLHKIRALQSNQAHRAQAQQGRAADTMLRGIATPPGPAGPAPAGPTPGAPTPSAGPAIATRAQVFPGTSVQIGEMQSQRAMLDTVADVITDPTRKQQAQALAAVGQQLESRLAAGQNIAPHEVTDWMESVRRMTPGSPEIDAG